MAIAAAHMCTSSFVRRALLFHDAGVPVLTYTAAGSSVPEFGNFFQQQAAAVPQDVSDPLLKRWRKLDSNPFLTQVCVLDHVASLLMHSSSDVPQITAALVQTFRCPLWCGCLNTPSLHCYSCTESDQQHTLSLAYASCVGQLIAAV
jgi:hypothetical protein